MGEVFGDSAFDSGILKVMNIKNSSLMDVTTDINNFQITNQNMTTLITEGVLNFDPTTNDYIVANYGDKTLSEFIYAIL